MITRLDHVAISVTDLDRSIEFYSQHFHMEAYAVHRQPVGQLLAIAYLRSPQGVLELMHAPGRQVGDATHFCFVSDDFDATFDRLVEEGVSVKRAPHPTRARVPTEEGWQRCVFNGPDGEEVELRGPSRRPTPAA